MTETPAAQWEAALARLGDQERHAVHWRYRMTHRRQRPDGVWEPLPFGDLAPAAQVAWIDYARKRYGNCAH